MDDALQALYFGSWLVCLLFAARVDDKGARRPPNAMASKALFIIVVALLGLPRSSSAQPAPGSCDGQNGNKSCFQAFDSDFDSCQCDFECVAFNNSASGCCADFFTVYGAEDDLCRAMMMRGW